MSNKILQENKEYTGENIGDGDTNYNWCTLNNPQRIGKRTERLGSKRSGDHPDFSFLKICQNTEKSPRDLWKLVTQNPGENHHLTLV